MIKCLLNATDPIISICKDNKWNYIFNLKPDRLKEINESFEDNINFNNETSIKDYYLSTNIEYKSHYLNVFKFVENIENRKTGKIKTTTFRYISNLNINDKNIEEIVILGRKR